MDDRSEERVLTQRCARHADGAAERGRDALLEARRLDATSMLKVQRERVAFDDNLDLDAGWRLWLITYQASLGVNID